MTRRATLIHGFGRRFGDRLRRGDYGRRLGGTNRLRRGGAGRRRCARGLAGFGGFAAFGVAAGAASIRLGRIRPVGRAGAAAAAVATAGRGGGSTSRAAPFATDFCASSVQDGAGSPGGRRCRRTSTTKERGGRFMATTTSKDLPLGRGAGAKSRPTRFAAALMLTTAARKMQATSTAGAPLLTGT